MENTQINLTLPLAQVNIIMAALGKAPYESVADVVQSIREQAIPQVPMPKVEEPQKQNG
jgi:hypothetical protein